MYQWRIGVDNFDSTSLLGYFSMKPSVYVYVYFFPFVWWCSFLRLFYVIVLSKHFFILIFSIDLLKSYQSIYFRGHDIFRLFVPYRFFFKAMFFVELYYLQFVHTSKLTIFSGTIHLRTFILSYKNTVRCNNVSNLIKTDPNSQLYLCLQAYRLLSNRLQESVETGFCI